MPRYFIVWLLRNIVSTPIATSIINDEKPLTVILPKRRNISFENCRRRVLLFLKKWVSITSVDMPAPIAVAIPAPRMPISSVNTQK